MSHFNRYKFNIGQYMKMDKQFHKKLDLNEQKLCNTGSDEPLLYVDEQFNISIMLDKLDPEENG